MSNKKIEEEKHRSDKIEETGQVTLDKNEKAQFLLSLEAGRTD